MAEEITVEEVPVADGPPVKNDPRGSLSLLAPILDPIDTTITPEQVISGEYEVPEIFSNAEMQQLPPGANFTFTNPDTNEVSYLTRVEADIPNVVEEYDGVFDALPVGAYFYPDKSRNPETLATKSRETPGLFARGRDRLLGADIDARGFGVEIPRIVSTTVGAMVGADLGAKLPVPANPFGALIKTGGIIGLGGLGASIGSIMPEQSLEWLERFGLIPEGTRDEYGYTDEELRTLFIGEGLLDMGISGTLATSRVLGRPTGQFIAGVAENATQMAKMAKDRGIAMLPIQVGNRQMARGYVSVMGRFPFFSGPFVREGRRVASEYTQLLQGLPSRLSPLLGINDLSVKIFKDAKNYVREIEKDFSVRYDDIFERAEAANIRVIPDNSLTEAQTVLKKLEESRTVRPDGTLNALSENQEIMRKFLVDEITSLREGASQVRVNTPGGRDPNTGILTSVTEPVPRTLEGGESLSATPQTLAQMDGVLGKLDAMMSKMRLNSGGKLGENLGNYYKTLSDSLKGDVKGNLVQPTGELNELGLPMFQRTPEGATGKIGSELGKLDEEFSSTISALFETSGAKMFEGVERQGLRGMGLPSRAATQRNIDTLATSLLRIIPRSPATVFELKRILPDETFRQLGAEYVNQLLVNSRSNKTGTYVVEKLRANFGIDSPDSPAYKGLDALLTAMRGTNDVDDVLKIVSMDEFRNVLDIGEQIARMEIPDVATFVARRAVLSGLRGGVSALNPLNIAGGVAAGTAVGASGFFGFLTALTAAGGGRLISNMLVNPATALPLKEAIEAEAKGLNNRSNFVRLARATLKSGATVLNWSASDISDAIDTFDDIMDRAEQEILEPLTEEPSEAVVAAEAALVPVPIADAEPPPFEAMRDNVPPPPIEVAQLPQQPTPIAVPPPRPAPQGIAAAAAASPESRAQYAAMFPDDMASGVIRSQGIGSLV